MARNVLRTKICDMLDIEYPIILAGMGGMGGPVSGPELVAAVATAGAFASLPSAMFSTGVELREDIIKTQSLTDKPFGVNINLLPMIKPVDNDEYIDITIEQGVNVIETSGRSPEPYIERIKKGNARLMHKCARVRDAKKAESLGADIVEVVGFECGGHPGRDHIGGLVLIPQVVDAVKIPVIVGGGIADARGFVAALALGAEGIVMGTRFLLSEECSIHPEVKDRLKEAESKDAVFALESLGDPSRVLHTDLVSKVEELEKQGASKEELLPLVAGDRSLQSLKKGDIENAFLACGQVIGLVREISTVKEIIDEIVMNSREIEGRLNVIFENTAE